MKIIFTIFTLILISFGFQVHAEQYLCIAEQSAGFAYDPQAKSWKATIFKTNAKYVLSRQKDEVNVFVVTTVGEKDPLCWSKKDADKGGFVLCDCLFGEFKFNNKDLRFLHTQTWGYFGLLPDFNKMTDLNSATPYMEIGKCASF